MMETLNELAHLRDSGFGQPWPRHGLKLLYWFANDCVSFGNDNVMLSECDPADGDFGFHLFENRFDEYGDKLLPDIDFPYYVVGNLNSPGAEELPEYISEDTYTGQHNRNTDRIIVSLYDEDWFHRVYVTQHNDRSNYDPNATYRISRGLLMIIRRMHLKDLHEKMDYKTYIEPFLPTPVFNYRPQTTNTVRPNFTAVTISSSDSDDSEPPAAIKSDDNEKTHYYKYTQSFLSMPDIPQTASTVSPDFTAVTPSSSDSDDSEPPETQINYTKTQMDEDKRTGYYTYTQPVLPTSVINYRPQTTSTVSPSSSDPAHKQPPSVQNNYIKILINDNEKTVSLPTPVVNYRPQTTSTVSPSSSDPAHKQPPSVQNNDFKILISLPTPVVNYRPQTTLKVSPEFTAVTISSSDPAHNEPPATQRYDTKIQFDDDTSSQHHLENLPKKKGLCKRFCTIL